MAAGDPELWGIAEIAVALGVTRRTVHYHAARPGFPEPRHRFEMGPAWSADDIRAWRRASAEVNGRKGVKA